jgi:hypothetical protein
VAYGRRVTEPDDSLDDLVLDLTVLAGVWADSTRVHRGRNEFTVDFVRRVPKPPGTLLVARAVASPIVGVELRDQLDEAWRGYTEWSMPGVGK